MKFVEFARILDTMSVPVIGLFIWPSFGIWLRGFRY
jgi:hypothetical protein